jgi:putative ABC transport system permease protein
MALAVVLLAGAGLLAASFTRLMTLEPGIDTDNAVAVRLWLPPTDFPDWDRVRLFYEGITAATQALPGVRAAGAVQTLPLGGSGTQLGAFAADSPPATPEDLTVTGLRTATPDYFRAAGVRLVRGRLIEASDRLDTPPVVLLSVTAARRLFGDRDPIGRVVQLTFARETVQAGGVVVGIVADTKVSTLAEEPQPIVYLAQSQLPMRSMELVVRAGPNSMALAPAIRDEIHRLAPNLPVHVRPLQHLVDDALAQTRFYALVLGAFALAALLLAAVGIFGVFSFTVAQRRREIGIRIALGAREATVVRMVIDHAGRLALAGIATGVVVALLLTRFLTGLLFGVSATDPLTFAAVSLLLLGVALLASYIPARAAARLDPLEALRTD